MPLPVSQETVRKRLMGIKDSRGPVGIFSRGKNIYRGVSARGNYKGAFGKGGVTVAPKNRWSSLAQKKVTAQPISPTTPTVTPPKTFEDYPYDREYEMGLADITRQGSNISSMQELATRRLGEDYGTSNRELELGFNQNLDRLIQRMANQGILRSGINVSEQGELGQEKARESELLERERSRGLEDINREAVAGRTSLQREKEQLDYERLQRLKQTELEAAQREAEAKANAALLKSLQPTPTGKIPLPGSSRTESMKKYREQLKRKYPKYTTAQLTALVRRKFPVGTGGKEPDPKIKALAIRRLEL